MMRPSTEVVDLKRGAEGWNGWRSVRVTCSEGAGWPVVWSRTWQVMGSLAVSGEDMVKVSNNDGGWWQD